MASRSIAPLVLIALAAGFASVAAAQSTTSIPGCAISASMVRPLNEAREAVVAGDVDLVIETLLNAQATSDRKTEYDKFLINSWLATAYMNKRELAKAAPLLMGAAKSPCATPAQRKGYTQTATAILKGLAGRTAR